MTILDAAAPYQDDLLLALELADIADALTWRRFGATDLVVETKPDLTPVSDADREAERLLRARLAEVRPQDGIVGEEMGVSLARPTEDRAEADSDPNSPGRRWVIDPIDGTKNFVRGVPVWATLIALVVGDDVVVGVVSAPALERRWWAAQGQGAWGQVSGGEPRRLQVSGVRNLESASLSYSSLTGWEERGLLPHFLELQASLWRTRAFGDFWSYMMVAEGAVDIAGEPELALHDMCALVPIVTEAGGRFTSLAGEPGPWGPDGLATNGLLHDEVVAAFGA